MICRSRSEPVEDLNANKKKRLREIVDTFCKCLLKLLGTGRFGWTRTAWTSGANRQMKYLLEKYILVVRECLEGIKRSRRSLEIIKKHIHDIDFTSEDPSTNTEQTQIIIYFLKLSKIEKKSCT